MSVFPALNLHLSGLIQYQNIVAPIYNVCTLWMTSYLMLFIHYRRGVFCFCCAVIYTKKVQLVTYTFNQPVTRYVVFSTLSPFLK